MPATIEPPQFVLSAQIGAVFPDEWLSGEVSEPGGNWDWIEMLSAQPGTRANGDIALDKTLTVYGFRHPSVRCGFCPEHYKDYLQKEIRL